MYFEKLVSRDISCAVVEVDVSSACVTKLSSCRAKSEVVCDCIFLSYQSRAFRHILHQPVLADTLWEI